MIKLIATDMDGTLLDEEGKLPEEFYDTLDKLNEKGIKFVIASGRPYCSLEKLFEERVNDLQFICDNGSCIVDDLGKSIEYMNREDVRNIIRDCNEIGELHLVLCGSKGIYIEKEPQWFIEKVGGYFKDVIYVDNLLDIDDEIYKMSICDKKGSRDNSAKILGPKYGEDFNVTVSASIWLDFTNKGINKGHGLKRIQDHFDISPEETMVFGDFDNDIEMLGRAKYSFVMENANDYMKEYGNYIAKSNKEHGVILAIEEYVLDNKR